MQKLQIVSVSGNSGSAFQGFDPVADSFLRSAGFKAPNGRISGSLSIGADPQDGRTFAVFYEEPKDDTKLEHTGKFRLVETTGGLEREIDHGSASKAHTHGGKGTFTFYGKGINLDSWSFHCQQPAETATNAQ